MIHEFDPVIYPRRIWITYDATAKELNEKFPEGDCSGKVFLDDDLKDSYGAEYSVGVVEPERKGGFLLRFPNKETMTPCNITHECIHAATGIFKYIGASVDTDNDEPFTYLVSWIVKCCETVKEKGE